MASNQKVEENRPPLKLNFTYWEPCIQSVYTCIYHVYYASEWYYISSAGLATVQNQILNMFIIPFYN